MNEKEYISDRLDDQINWYDNKGQWNQKLYKRLRVIEILCAASIPFLVGYVTESADFMKTIVGLLGVIVTVVAGVLALYKFQENWIQYRTTSESLKHEKYLYLSKTKPYDIKEPYPLLVQRVEFVISRENTDWAQYVKITEEGE